MAAMSQPPGGGAGPVEVRLYGELARRFGRVHLFCAGVRSAADAMRAMAATRPGFAAWMRAHSAPGYRVRSGRRDVSAQTLAHGLGGARVLRVVPTVAGAGKGLGQVILGAILVGVGVMTGGAGLSLGAAWAAGGSTFVGAMAAKVGAALVLGGVAQMLAPTTRTPGTTDRPENQPSYAFDGPINTSAQGNPVPVLYGRLIVGGQVVSAGLQAQEWAA